MLYLAYGGPRARLTESLGTSTGGDRGREQNEWESMGLNG